MISLHGVEEFYMHSVLLSIVLTNISFQIRSGQFEQLLYIYYSKIIEIMDQWDSDTTGQVSIDRPKPIGMTGRNSFQHVHYLFILHLTPHTL